MGPTIHCNNRKFPKSNWTFPNYQQFFFRPEVAADTTFTAKPLFMIFNKYTPEIHLGGTPKNFIPLDALQEILDYLSPRYHVVYIRLERKELLQADDLRASGTFGDKAMIRQRYTNNQVFILDDLADTLDAEAVNLLIFALGAHCRNFVSVQGGNSQVASFFGGQNYVLVKGKVSEVTHGDYTYYWRYANTKVKMVRKQEVLVQRVKENM